MIVKAFEIRDSATFIPVLAVNMVQSSNWPAGTKAEESESERIAEAERYLLARSGYGRNPSDNPEPCEVCGIPESHAHHDDYSRPLDVRWLCEKHHKQLHKERRQENGSLL